MFRERMQVMVTVGLAFLVAIIVLFISGARWWWILVTAVVGVGFLVFSTRRGRHTSWATARSTIAPGHAVVFWKPGCMYCERLLRAIGEDDRVTWVNVWADKDANAEVRRHNDGDELTPTALVGERVLRNPTADELVQALR